MQSASYTSSFEILRGILLYIFRFKINKCYTVVSVLVLGTGIARGQYYWILDIGCLVWYRSKPKFERGKYEQFIN